MVRGMLVVALLGAAGSLGCQSPANEEPIVQQVEFDLTVAEDRARFKAHDLDYQGSVGPYAVYKVTGSDPRLEGPRIDPRAKNVGYAMLCGARSYFVDQKTSTSASIALLGGYTGDVKILSVAQSEAGEGECADPKDVFSNPLPDGSGSGSSGDGSGGAGGNGGAGGAGGTGSGAGGTNDGCLEGPCDGNDPNGDGRGGTGGTGSGTGGGAGGGGTGGTGSGTGGGAGGGGAGGAGSGTGGTHDGCIEGPCDGNDTGNGGGGTGGTGSGTGSTHDGCIEPPCSGSDTGNGGTPGAGSGSSGSTADWIIFSQKINIGFDAKPPLGATVLLRRVALTGARLHNDSHVIPSICCKGTMCTLKAAR